MSGILALVLFSIIGLVEVNAVANRSFSAYALSSLSPLQRLSASPSSSSSSTSSLKPTPSNSLCAGTTTITETQALSDLSACTTFYGDLTVASITASAQSNEQTATIAFDSLKHIGGDLVFTNLTGVNGTGDRVGLELGAPLLEKVGDRLKFLHSSSELSLAFPKIQYLEGIIYDSVDLAPSSVPGYNLESHFGYGVSTVYIHNTTAKSVSLIIPEAGQANVVLLNNSQLTAISIDGQYDNPPPSDIEIAGNGPGLSFTTSLSRIGRGIISGCTEMQASELINVELWLTLNNNTFHSLTLPTLNSASHLDISSNPLLQTIDLPAFDTANDLNFTNNPNLDDILLPQLSKVSDQLRIVDGTFTSIALPALTSISAGFTIISNSTLNCDGVHAAEQYAKLFQVSFTCTGVPNSNISASQNGSGGHTNQLSTPAKAGIGVSAAVVGIALAAGAAIMYYKRRRSRRSRPNAREEKHELDGDDVYEFSGIVRSEMYASPGELHDGYESELYAPHGASELQVEVEQKCHELP